MKRKVILFAALLLPLFVLAQSNLDKADDKKTDDFVHENYFGGFTPEEFQLYKDAAKAGDVDAQYNVGYCYENGEGVEQNYSEAAKWYRKAAEQGLSAAQHGLGFLYAYGQGVKEN